MQRNFAKCVIGVDAPHDHRQLAKGGIEIKVAVNANLDTIHKIEAVLHQDGTHLGHFAAPQVDVQLITFAVGSLLNKREVGVRTFLAQPRDFAPYPQARVKVVVQCLVDRVGQFRN